MKKFCIFLVSLFLVNGTMAQSDKPCVQCLPEGIEFNTQEEIDNFQVNHPGCTEIIGDVVINSGDAINNLNGLSLLTSIGGNLNVVENNSLSGFSGLEGLTSIGYWLNIVFNNSLENLNGLNGLRLVNGGLVIQGNQSLTALTGLDSISAASITDLRILNNSSLSICDIYSICHYLSTPDGTIEIHDNATGCNSQQEVEDSCAAIGIQDLYVESSLSLFPNPATISVTIETQTKEILFILNSSGRQLMQHKLTAPATTIDISDLPGGMYVVKVVGEKGVQMGKFIKQ